MAIERSTATWRAAPDCRMISATRESLGACEGGANVDRGCAPPVETSRRDIIKTRRRTLEPGLVDALTSSSVLSTMSDIVANRQETRETIALLGLSFVS